MARKAEHRHPQWVGPPPCSWLDAGKDRPCGAAGHYITSAGAILCKYHGDRARRDGRPGIRRIPSRAMDPAAWALNIDRSGGWHEPKEDNR